MTRQDWRRWQAYHSCVGVCGGSQQAEGFRKLRQGVAATLSRAGKKAQGKVVSLTRSLHDARASASTARQAEIIMANLHRYGQSSVHFQSAQL